MRVWNPNPPTESSLAPSVGENEVLTLAKIEEREKKSLEKENNKQGAALLLVSTP